MSFRQDRVNPSTYIANWKGRTSTEKAWPSTSVSTWMNGGLFGGGGGSWCMSIDLNPGDAMGDYGYSWGCHWDSTNEELYWTGGTAGLGTEYPRIGKLDKNGNQLWCYQYYLDSTPANWEMTYNGAAHWLDTEYTQSGSQTYKSFFFKGYNKLNSSYPGVWWTINPSDGTIYASKKIQDTYGWSFYTYGRGAVRNSDHIYYPLGMYTSYSGTGTCIIDLNWEGGSQYNVRLWSGSDTQPGDVLYGPGGTVGSHVCTTSDTGGRLTYYKNDEGNLSAVGQMLQQDTAFGTTFFWCSGYPGSGAYTYPFRNADNAFALAKVWPDNNTTSGTWYKSYSLTSPGALASIRDGHGGDQQAMDSAGNSYLLGRDYGGGHAFQDALYIIKVDSSGVLQWSRAFKFSNTAIASPGTSPPYRAGIDCSDEHVYIHVGLADGDGYNYIIAYEADGSALGTVSLPGNWSCEAMTGTATDSTISPSAAANATQNANAATNPFSPASTSSSRDSAQTPTLVLENF